MTVYNPPTFEETNPGGLNTNVQYNDNGVFGGEDDFVYDEINKAIGIQTATPDGVGHFVADTPGIVNVPTSLTAIAVAEVVLTAPTISSSQIGAPGDASGLSASQVTGYTDPYIANGSSYTYRVYGYKTYGSTNYYSGNYSEYIFTDDNSSNQYSVSLSWSGGGFDGYVLEKDGSYYNAGAVTSYIDQGWPGGGALPTNFNSVAYTPITATVDNSSTAALQAGSNNYGTGAATADGTTSTTANIYAYENIGGTLYYVGSASSNTGSDDSSFQSFSTTWNWSAVTNAQGYVIQISGNVGGVGSWNNSVDVGNTTTYTDDYSSSGSATIPTLFSGIPTTRNYTPIAAGLSPAGSVYYKAGANHTFANSGSSLYIIQHIVTPGATPGTNSQVFGATDGTSLNRRYAPGGTSYTFYETSSFWDAQIPEVTQTPIHYGYQAGTADFPRTYGTRSYKTSGGTDYYSSSVASSTSDPGGSGYYSITLSYTPGSNTNGVKSVRSSNPIGTGFYKTTSTTYYDDKISTWNDSSTVTPTAVPQNGLIIERTNTAITEPSFLELRSAVGSTVHGVVQSITSTGTNIYKLLSTGGVTRLYNEGGTFDLYGSSTRFIRLSETVGNIFNDQRNSGGGTLFKTSPILDGLWISHGNGNVSIGESSNSSQDTLIVRQASSGRIGITLKAFNSSPGNDLMQVQTDAGGITGGITPLGRWRHGAGSSASDPGLFPQGNTTSGRWSITSGTIGESASGVEVYRWNSTGISIKTIGAPTARLHIAAQTTAANTAPIKLTPSSSLMSSVESGAIEGGLNFMSYTTSSSVRTFLLSSAAIPTSGRIPYATTNGFMLDVAGFTFDASTGLTIAARNIITDTTTGTKIGTATTQKLGFFNATPIVQPTGNIITALTNLGLVATPTLPASSVSSGAALTKTDDTNVTLALGGTPTTALLAATSLTLGWTGILSAARGGTGVAKEQLFDHFTDANNGTTVETDLYSDTLTAGQFATNGQKIVAQYGGIFVGDATSTQQLKAYFGGTVIFDSGALGVGVGTTNWDLYITIIRVSSSVVRCSATLNTSFASLSAYAQYTEVTGLTLANTQVLKITGTAAGVTGASNQITAKEGYVEFKNNA